MRGWLFAMITGGLCILGGILALANPFTASMAATSIVAWTFLFIGALLVVSTFSAEGWGYRVLVFLLGLVFILLAWSLIANPLAGLLRLTLVVAILFVASGVAKVIAAFGFLRTPVFLPVLLSGVVSLALGIMTLSNFPYSAGVMLGILLAVELLSSGVSIVAYALAARKDPGLGSNA